jgi:hypothetical protein
MTINEIDKYHRISLGYAKVLKDRAILNTNERF